MNEFYFMKILNSEILYTIEDLTRLSNVFIKEVHVVPGKTTIQYEILSEEGFKLVETSFLNNLKK